MTIPLSNWPQGLTTALVACLFVRARILRRLGNKTTRYLLVKGKHCFCSFALPLEIVKMKRTTRVAGVWSESRREQQLEQVERRRGWPPPSYSQTSSSMYCHNWVTNEQWQSEWCMLLGISKYFDEIFWCTVFSCSACKANSWSNRT